MSESKSNSGGVGVLTVVGIVLVILKVAGVIDWSWWLVTMPFWIGLVIMAVIAIIIGVIMLMQRIFK